MKSSYFAFLLFMLIGLPSVSAVGISGFDLDIETVFVPDGEFSFGFIGVANKQYDGIDHSTFADGDIAEYVTFKQSVFKSVSKGAYVPIDGTIHYPHSLAPPIHRIRVCFMEECPQGGMVCGRTAACALVIVYVPYSGIHPSLSLHAPNTNEDQPVEFQATVKNNGDTTISLCTGFVEVFDIRNNNIGRAALSSAENIESFGSAGMNAVFNTKGILPGNYSAKATVSCDGIISNATSGFRIGTLNVKITGYTTEISAGSIQRFVTKVESAWNDPLDISGKVRIYDSNTSVETKTATVKVDAWKTLDLEAFIDASNLQEKEYDASIEIFYGGKSTVKQGKVLVTAAKEGVIPPVVEAPKEGISATTLTFILVIVVVLLTAFNIFLAIYRKKK